MPHHFLVIGDVGGSETYHVGDEGMLDANLDRLRALSPRATVTVISRDPDWTARTYDTEAIEPIGFPEGTAEPGESEDRLEALLEAVAAGELASGFERRSQAQGVIGAIRKADAVVISGGGNLNATWPEHLYERIALLALAERLDTPAVVLGQTIGPQLSETQRRRLSESLKTARLVGVRERESYDLVEKLGVPTEIIHYQLDDAIFLGRLSDPKFSRPELRQPYLAITLCGQIDGLNALASQIESLAGTMKADIVFIPHAKEPDQDRELGARFGEALSAKARFRLLDVLPAREVAAITGAAEMVVSTRYHPLVFASAMGVPSLGLSTDAYTHQKLAGTHAHAGLQEWVLPIELAVEGLLAPASRELWKKRDKVGRHLEDLLPRWEANHDLHWQRVTAALVLGDEETPDPRPSRPEVVKGVPPRGEWSRVKAAHTRIAAVQASKLLEMRQHAEDLVDVLASREKEIDFLQPALDKRTEEIASLETVVEAREIEIRSLREALQAREKELGSLRPTLAAREKELGSLRPVLESRNEQLASLKPILKARNEELASLKASLVAREKELKSLQPTLAAREKELASLRPILAARDEELASLRPILAARDEELASLRPILAARDEELASLRPILAARDEELAAIRSILAGRDEELASIRPILAARDEELASIKPVLTAREEELAGAQEGLIDSRAELERTQSALSRSEASLGAYRNSWSGRLARRLGLSPEAGDGETS